MAKQTVIHRKVMDPKTFTEAKNMVIKGWGWLLKKQPVFFGPLTLWMLFGGGIFLYNYTSANKVQIKEAQPLSEIQQKSQDIQVFPSLYASEPLPAEQGIPIMFDGKLWGYEDTTLVAKAVMDKALILVYDKDTHKVYEVKFGTETTHKSLFDKIFKKN